MVIFFAILFLPLIISASFNCATNRVPNSAQSKRSSRERSSKEANSTRTQTCNSGGMEEGKSTGENSKTQPESNQKSRNSKQDSTNNTTASPSDLKFDIAPSEPSDIKTNLESLQGDVKPNPPPSGKVQIKKLGAGARDLLPSQSNKGRNNKPVPPPGSDIIYPSLMLQKTQYGQ